MGCIKDIPTLKGDIYSEWHKGVALTLACGDVDWVVTTPQPVKPKEPKKSYI
jgi:hypothetical protein